MLPNYEGKKCQKICKSVDESLVNLLKSGVACLRSHLCSHINYNLHMQGSAG